MGIDGGIGNDDIFGNEGEDDIKVSGTRIGKRHTVYSKELPHLVLACEQLKT